MKKLIIHSTQSRHCCNVSIYELKPNNFTDLIHLNGKVESLLNKRKGDDHLVYVGGLYFGKEKDTRNEAQIDSMTKYVMKFITETNGQVCGANQLEDTLSPGFNVPEWLLSIGVKPKNIYNNEQNGNIAPISDDNSGQTELQG